MRINYKNIRIDLMQQYKDLKDACLKDRDLRSMWQTFDRVFFNMLMNEDEQMFIMEREEQFRKTVDGIHAHYRKNELPKVRETIMEFVREMRESDPEFTRSARMEYLTPKIEEAKETTATLKKAWLDVEKQHWGESEWLRDMLKEQLEAQHRESDRKYNKLLKEYMTLEQIGQNRITEVDIQEARNKWVGDYIEVKRTVGGRGMAICPFHDDNHPSMTIYEAGRGYHCFACGEGGDTIDFVMKLNDLNFIEAVKFLVGK